MNSLETRKSRIHTKLTNDCLKSYDNDIFLYPGHNRRVRDELPFLQCAGVPTRGKGPRLAFSGQTMGISMYRWNMVVDRESGFESNGARSFQ